jgi:hypothetical protein
MLGHSASSPQVLYAGTAITPPKKNPAVQYRNVERSKRDICRNAVQSVLWTVRIACAYACYPLQVACSFDSSCMATGA